MYEGKLDYLSTTVGWTIEWWRVKTIFRWTGKKRWTGKEMNKVRDVQVVRDEQGKRWIGKKRCTGKEMNKVRDVQVRRDEQVDEDIIKRAGNKQFLSFKYRVWFTFCSS